MKAYRQACDSLAQRGLAAYRDVASKACVVTTAALDLLARSYKPSRAAEPRTADVERAQKWLKEN